MSNVTESSKDPVTTKKKCPDFEAAFLDVESTTDFPGTAAAVEAVKPEDSIFKDMQAPHLVLTSEECQYVNFKEPLDELRDEIPGTNIKFAADRMGQKPRILVRFKEQKAFKFKLKLIADKDNVKYYPDEEARNPNFKQVLDPGKEYSTNDKGYLVIKDDFILGAAAGNKYTIEVEVTEDGYEGTLKKHFTDGALRTARYLWMLSVTGGKDRWVPTYDHAACLAPTIGMYNGNPHIHINSKRLAPQHVPEFECVKETERKGFYSMGDKFKTYLAQAKDGTGNSYPAAMKKYIFIALMSRFVYIEKKGEELKDSVPLDGNKHVINIMNFPVVPFSGALDKSYLISATGTYIDLKKLLSTTSPLYVTQKPALLHKALPMPYRTPPTFYRATPTLSSAFKRIDISNCTYATGGYNINSVQDDENGHVGCSQFVIDTAGLPRGGNLSVTIKYNGMTEAPINGTHWSTKNASTGFFFFRSQLCKLYSLTERTAMEISSTASHEFGHAVQMVANGENTKPNKTNMYYADGDTSLANELKSHSGPHCCTNFSAKTPTTPTVHGTCIMYGAAHSNRKMSFCSITTGPEKAALEASKKNDCTMAVRKVDLVEPFSAYR